MARRRKSSNRGEEESLKLRDGLEFMAGDTLVQLRVDQQLATVFLDSYESSCINLLDPRDLEFEYMQHMTAAVDAFMPDRPIEALHLGGCACALALAWDFARPESAQTVVELNGALAESMRELFQLPRAPRLKIRVGEAFDALTHMAAQRFDVIVRDVFMGAHVPPNLRSDVFFETAMKVVRPGGLVLVNCIHGQGVDARVDCAGALSAFKNMVVVSEAKVLHGGRRGNVVIVGYRPIDEDDDCEPQWLQFQRLLCKLPMPTRVLNRAETKRWVGTTAAITMN